MRPLSPLPIPVKKALRKLGEDIRYARLRRRITMKLMAERAFISRTTLTSLKPATLLSLLEFMLRLYLSLALFRI